MFVLFLFYKSPMPKLCALYL